MRENKENKLPTQKEEERENKKLLKRERRNKTQKKKNLSILLITSIKRQRLSLGFKELLNIFHFKRHKKLKTKFSSEKMEKYVQVKFLSK